MKTPDMRALPSVLSSFALLPLIAWSAGCSVAPASEDATTSEADLRTSYADLGELLSDTDADRWWNVKQALAKGFDDICGDTICGGDYSNLTTVRIKCSATRATQKLRDCAWVLGGSIEYVDPASGAVTSQPRVFSCKVAVGSKAGPMLDALSAAGKNALNTPLPGTDRSFYDALTDCFSGVVGSPPPASEDGPFVELSEHLWGTDEGAALSWFGTQRKLNEGFRYVCGDSFCEGEYPDIEGLRFTCAVDASKNKVRSCTWSFALAETSIDASGRIRATTATKTCSVALYVNPATLVNALANDDPLNTRLPGKQTSLYQALIGCL